MYFPPSQIETDLYTNGGQFQIASNDQPYEGYYFRTSEDKYYTGKNPNNPPNLLLKSTPDNNSADPEEQSPSSFSRNASLYTLPGAYLRNTSLNLTQPPLGPIQINPNPTSEQYELGEFQRYFTKKRNSFSYTEISQDQFKMFNNQSSTVDFKLYLAFQIPWVISGNRNNAYNVNEKTVNRVSNNLNLYGFKSYFKGQFSQYFEYKENENLYTGGGEYRIRGSIKDYVGYYHIHPDKGAMVGSQHTTKPHEYLDSIKNMVKKKIGKRSGGY